MQMWIKTAKWRLARLKLAILARFFPPRYWVATYGDMGLEVEFYRREAEYENAVAEAEAEHDDGGLDSFTYGEVSA